jgi:hypothetical protein
MLVRLFGEPTLLVAVPLEGVPLVIAAVESFEDEQRLALYVEQLLQRLCLSEPAAAWVALVLDDIGEAA